MMSFDPFTPTPAPRAGNATRPRRPTPCAGLFGWRKDAAQPGASDGKPAPPRYDYPAI
jgi:hypothetical protein